MSSMKPVQSIPEFIVFKGPMAGGKTTRLLSALERYRFQHRDLVVFKPSIDGRYSQSEVVSHSGVKTPAVQIPTGDAILTHITGLETVPAVIAVDEQFMIPGSGAALIWLFQQGITVLVSTLDLSFSGKVFDEVRAILPWATKVEACPAVCVLCGNDAYYTYKSTASKEEVEVGGFEMYQPRCFHCHPQINRE